ncbi:MAG: ATP synthase subunit I [Gammaproteobacteria bacterium]|nr:ATP synthase subunit I [Gammaproteobacteria bacterium]
MSGWMALVPAVIAGAGLGLIYFGGLWLTVRRLPGADRPTLLFGGSLVLRLSLTLAGFYLVMDGSWERMLACLGGFIVARQALVSRLRPARTATVGGEGVQP